MNEWSCLRATLRVPMKTSIWLSKRRNCIWLSRTRRSTWHCHLQLPRRARCRRPRCLLRLHQLQHQHHLQHHLQHHHLQEQQQRRQAKRQPSRRSLSSRTSPHAQTAGLRRASSGRSARSNRHHPDRHQGMRAAVGAAPLVAALPVRPHLRRAHAAPLDRSAPHARSSARTSRPRAGPATEVATQASGRWDLTRGRGHTRRAPRRHSRRDRT